jgi:hypothetical protein
MGTDVGKSKMERDLSGTDKIAEVWLRPGTDNSVVLQMWPGDTLTQSRALYRDRSAVEAILRLRSEGWRVEPNFHWGFMATGYAWVKTPLEVDRYCDYWVKEIGTTRELSRTEWEPYWAMLSSSQIVEAADKEEFHAHFTRTDRQKASPRPGLMCKHKWPLAEAQRLDDAHGTFVVKVQERVNQMLTAVNAHPSVLGSQDANVILT